jgi:hypothetical protein
MLADPRQIQFGMRLNFWAKLDMLLEDNFRKGNP